MNKSQKIKEATRLCHILWVLGHLDLSFAEYLSCRKTISNDPTGALRSYRALANSYGRLT